MDGMHKTKPLTYSRSRQILRISLHIASAHVTQKIHSEMAHLNRTFHSFSLLFHLEQCRNSWLLLLFVVLVNNFFPFTWLGIPKIFTENTKNPQKAQVKKRQCRSMMPKPCPFLKGLSDYSDSSW